MRNVSSVLGKLAKSISVCLMLVFTVATGSNAQDASNGGALFRSNACNTCHAIGRQLTGPDLAGLSDRREEDWIVRWVQNPQGMVDSGDPIAVELKGQYPTMMAPYSHLSDDDVRDIVAYLQAEEVRIAERKQQDAVSGGGAATEVGTFQIVLISILVLVVIAIAVVLSRVSRTLERMIVKNQDAINKQQEEYELQAQGKSFGAYARAYLKNKKLVFFTVLMLVALLGVVGWKTAWNIGVHDGYMPVQPIKFSHQIHAGVNQIDCQYCHGGAYESKNASIPSANICMNCHNTITGGDHYENESGISPEIAKLYRAVDWDPETRTYGNNTKPIEWVRIHNLPDFAYFNHSQHVVVAGVECQTCHGPIENMEEVYQYSPLTMKWCIDCHRDTEVDANNSYYDQLIDAHEKLKKGEKMTAAMVGGLECGKCHY